MSGIPDLILNGANITYEYTVEPGGSSTVARENSNQVLSQVNMAVIALTKQVDKSFAEENAVLTYTFLIENTGNADATNLILTDTLPIGTEFITGSMQYNGAVISGSPVTGINLGRIAPDSINTLVFKVKVIGIPSVNPMANLGTAAYNFTVDPVNPDGESDTAVSNTVTTRYIKGGLEEGDFVKSSDKKSVKRGDVITYSFYIDNHNDVDIKNVVLTEALDASVSFVPDSVTVNGVAYPTYNPIVGMNLGILAAGTSMTVAFKVLVESIPASGEIRNIADLQYQYTVDPSDPDVEKEIKSNEITVNVREACIDNADQGFVKTVDSQFAAVGDILSYTLKLQNTGNVTADNCVLNDELSNEASFIPGTLTIDATAHPNITSLNNVSLGSISSGQILTITFQVNVNSMPTNFIVTNKNSILFDYIQESGQPAIPGSGFSNQTETGIKDVDFTGNNFVKSTSPVYAALGDEINYSFVIQNAGNTNALNVILRDEIPKELQFVKGSVTFDGKPILTGELSGGISLGKFEPNVRHTLAFKAKVITLPEENPISNMGWLEYEKVIDPSKPAVKDRSDSNQVSNTILAAVMEIKKLADRDSAAIGDILTFTITAQNKGNTETTSFIIRDLLSDSLEFVKGSILINGVAMPTEDIKLGVDAGKIAPGAAVKLIFQAKVLSLPPDKKLINQVKGETQFIVDPEMPPHNAPSNSNETEIQIENPSLKITKAAEVDIVKLGDIISYTVSILNDGTVTAKNIIFYDQPADKLNFIQGSFILNDSAKTTADINTGVNIGDLDPGERITLKYKVKVTGGGDCEGTAGNAAFARFNYQLTSSGAMLIQTTEPVVFDVSVSNPIFKQLSLDGSMEIPTAKPDMEDINDVSVSVEITDYRIIKTVKGKADDNTILTGYKLLISGTMTQIVEYTANTELQEVHSAHFTSQIFTFIILPEEASLNSKIKFSTQTEDIYFKKQGRRELFTNITLMISAVISNSC